MSVAQVSMCGAARCGATLFLRCSLSYTLLECSMWPASFLLKELCWAPVDLPIHVKWSVCRYSRAVRRRSDTSRVIRAATVATTNKKAHAKFHGGVDVTFRESAVYHRGPCTCTGTSSITNVRTESGPGEKRQCGRQRVFLRLGFVLT